MLLLHGRNDDKSVKLAETEKLSASIRKFKSSTEYKYIVRVCVDGKCVKMTKADIAMVNTEAE
ncbi:MAG: hypothetical protein ACI4KG_06925 [Oscillospiraceae bacterium]